MRVVRQRMIKTFGSGLPKGMPALLVVLMAILTSCNPTEITSSGQRGNMVTDNYDGSYTNKAFIYRDSPAIIEGPNYGPKVNMNSVIDMDKAELITTKTQLKGDCFFSFLSGSSNISDCLYSYGSKSALQQLVSRPSNGSWMFTTGSNEFYQVNGLWHVQKGVNKFFEKLQFAYNRLHVDLPLYQKSIPTYLPNTGLHWFQAISPANDNYFRNSFLSVYNLCNLELNASFNPAGPELCFGKWSAQPTFLFVQDPSVIYHELGHALIAVMMNFRNGTFVTPTLKYHDLRSNLGGYGYDEAGSIGEGIADYYSFVMNKRTHIGEWALAKSMNGSRPMSEDDPLHIPDVSTTSEGRLSYPQYLLYDPNAPDEPFEDVHYAGQIVSHYLVALTKSLQTSCSTMTSDNSHDLSTSYVMLVMAETLSEIGDLNGSGLDNTSGSPKWNPRTLASASTDRFANLDEKASYVWTQLVNPPTYRRFFQIFAKNINRYISDSITGLCPTFDKYASEKLLDDYGLLLFNNYNDDGTSTKLTNRKFNRFGSISTSTVPPTSVNEENRRKSVLINKDLISLAEVNSTKDVATYYIIDDRKSMQTVLENLLFKGFPVSTTNGVSSVEYNNANIRISPGEIVAIIPNLYNSSNSTMAGVQLLANDWDHVDITDTTGQTGNYKPCAIDDVTTAAQGAETGQTCTTTSNPTYPTLAHYRRLVKGSTGKYCYKGATATTINSAECNEAVAPVCLVQLEENNATRWVSQNEFRKKQGLALQDKDCLGYGGTAQTDDFSFNPHECLVRFLPGANRAFFSKIDPQKSYVETMRQGNNDHSFGPGNALVMEVNKWIPPGTKFRCRMRARFSNCSDCYYNSATSDDYIDAEYNGAKPYKIINFEFDVND